MVIKQNAISQYQLFIQIAINLHLKTNIFRINMTYFKKNQMVIYKKKKIIQCKLIPNTYKVKRQYMAFCSCCIQNTLVWDVACLN